MPNQQLTDYIKNSKVAGQTDEQIKSALISSGWQEMDINDAFSMKSDEVIYHHQTQKSKPSFLKKFLFFLASIIGQIVAMILLYFILIFVAVGMMAKSLIFAVLFLLPIALIISSIVWVCRDCKRFSKSGVETMAPGNWAGIIFLFWFPALSFYLTIRQFNYKRTKI